MIEFQMTRATCTLSDQSKVWMMVQVKAFNVPVDRFPGRMTGQIGMALNTVGIGQPNQGGVSAGIFVMTVGTTFSQSAGFRVMRRARMTIAAALIRRSRAAGHEGQVGG